MLCLFTKHLGILANIVSSMGSLDIHPVGQCCQFCHDRRRRQDWQLLGSRLYTWYRHSNVRLCKRTRLWIHHVFAVDIKNVSKLILSILAFNLYNYVSLLLFSRTAFLYFIWLTENKSHIYWNNLQNKIETKEKN